MRSQDVWLVDLARPWMPVWKIHARIEQGPKFTWAKRCDGRRHLLGGSAFFLEAGAQRRRVHLLKQIVRNSFLQWQTPYRWTRALQALKNE